MITKNNFLHKQHKKHIIATITVEGLETTAANFDYVERSVHHR